MNNFEKYKELSAQSICQATMIFDLARSAEKLVDPNCSGLNNPAWSEGPYLAPYVGAPEIPKAHPYVIMISIESQAAVNISHTGSASRAPTSNDGIIQLILPENNGSRADRYISKLVTIEQFEILKDFLVSISAPINKKQSLKSIGKIEPVVLSELEAIIARRNELTHEISPPISNMREAVEYYNSCIWLAQVFNDSEHYGKRFTLS
ncbi:hypothetical protein R6242_18395 [Iodobacter sp. CM08]|uniref:hypothetical protein n=1 Tax=Iodobacter sp. CM08 TaxID=3085902 RepID=UPI0029823DCB|nr:hypothetical protein [Iodobacter sp. CM08]MDW5418538.1 hypothetical protein [Iodobacter sp. CM08]